MEKSPNLNQVNAVLYGNTILKNLWPVEKKRAQQLFLEHSDEKPNMFAIPSVWAPIVLCLLKDLVKMVPNIHFYMVKEKFGELRVYTKPPEEYRSLVKRMIHAASEAVNTITLAQLEITNSWYRQRQ